jgi:glutaredoxin
MPITLATEGIDEGVESRAIDSMRTVVTVFSKEGCHLCEKVIETLNSLSARFDLQVMVVDISDDPRHHDKYLLTIPVVQISGEDIFDARDMAGDTSDARTLEQLLKSRASTSTSFSAR